MIWLRFVAPTPEPGNGTTKHAKGTKVETEIVFKEESYAIMGACFEVHKEKGNGFLEAVYQECLAIELAERGIAFVATGKQLGLWVNFGHFPKIEHERFVSQPSRVAREELSCLSRIS